MSLLFYLFLATLPLGKVLNQSIYESDRKSVPLDVLNVVVALLVSLWIARRMQGSGTPFRSIPHSRRIALFVVWAVASLIFNKFYFHLNLEDTVVSGLYLARWVEYALLYFVTYDLVAGGLDARRITRWLMGGGVVFCIFGSIQAAVLPDFALTLHPEARPGIDWDAQGHRLVSTILDPNIAAGYILIFTLVALAFYIAGFKRWLPLLVVFAIALGLTLSRGGILGFVVGFASIMLTNRSRWKALLAALTVITLVAVLLYPLVQTEVKLADRIAIDDASALGRVNSWLLLFDVIRNNLGFGIGFNTLGFVALDYGIVKEGALAFGLESDPLMILAMTGVAGLWLYANIFRHLLRDNRQLRANSAGSWNAAFSTGVTAAFWGLLASSFFTTLLLFPQVMAVLWVLWAIAQSLHRNAHHATVTTVSLACASTPA